MAPLLLAGERLDAGECLRTLRLGEIRSDDLGAVKECHATSVDPQFLAKARVVQAGRAVAGS
jgi:hypothetical protein